ncbi:hypothetical protein [Mycolicibacterium sp. CBMA 226]|uniref:hypothetical protein n=1 Tax=Mycolicibacterium sp. CBMA 226 TaxID=2606611 RepID=UPI001AA0E17C|nr:hypothetical protein [Mycolicibacterium sp. CBMA 226]
MFGSLDVAERPVLYVLVGIPNLPQRSTTVSDGGRNGHSAVDRRPCLCAHRDRTTKRYNGQLNGPDQRERSASSRWGTFRFVLTEITDPFEQSLRLIQTTCSGKQIATFILRVMKPEAHPGEQDGGKRYITFNTLPFPPIDVVQVDLDLFQNDRVTGAHMCSASIVVFAVSKSPSDRLAGLFADRNNALGKHVPVRPLQLGVHGHVGDVLHHQQLVALVHRYVA